MNRVQCNAMQCRTRNEKKRNKNRTIISEHCEPIPEGVNLFVSMPGRMQREKYFQETQERFDERYA